MFFSPSKPPGGPAPIRLISNGDGVKGVLVNNDWGAHPQAPRPGTPPPVGRATSVRGAGYPHPVSTEARLLASL